MGWLIFAGIIAVVALILMIPLHITAEWNKDFSLKIRYWFLKFTVYPLAEKKKKKTAKKSVQKEKTPHEKKVKRKKYADEIIDEIIDVIEKYSDSVRSALKNIRVHYFEGYWKITDSDAAECALKYGRACAGLNIILAFFRNFMKIENMKLKVYPDFVSEQDEIRAKADIELNPLIAFISFLKIALIFFKDSFSKSYKNKPNKLKVKECV